MKNRHSFRRWHARGWTVAAAALAMVVGGAIDGVVTAPVRAQAPAADRCVEAVQGEVAWNYEGDRRWAPANVRKLCASAEESTQPAECFREVMHGGVNWGGGTRWQWENALDLCRGTRDANGTVDCIEDRIGSGLPWKQAIEACRWDIPGNGGERGGSGDDDEDSTDPVSFTPRGATDCDDPTRCSVCVDNVEQSFRGLEGAHTYVFNNTGHGEGPRSDETGDHSQGVARVLTPGRASVLAYSTSDGLGIVEFPKLAGYGEAWEYAFSRGHDKWDKGRIVRGYADEALPDQKHWGGMQGWGRYMVVGSNGLGRAYVSIHDLSNPGAPRRVNTIPVDRLTPPAENFASAHYVGLTRLRDGRYLAFAAQDGREILGEKEHRFAFFRSTGTDLHDTDWRYLGIWDRGGEKDNQSGTLLTECGTGDVYFVGLGKGNSKLAGIEGDIDVWKINRVNDGRVRTAKVFSHHYDARRKHCNFNAGSSVHVTPSHRIAVYCIQKKEKRLPRKDGKLHVKEFTNQDDPPGQMLAGARNEDFCIHKAGRGDRWANGTPVHVWRCDAGPRANKTWVYDHKKKYLRLAANPSKCLHKRDDDWANGNPVHVWDCDAGKGRMKKWLYHAETGLIQAKKNKDKCLHKRSPGWHNGNQLHLWDCSAGDQAAKTWTLVPPED